MRAGPLHGPETWFAYASEVAQEFRPGLRKEELRAAIEVLSAPLNRHHLDRLTPRRQASELNVLLFGLAGFGVEKGRSPGVAASLIDSVLRERRGRPAVLAIVYAEVACRLGITVSAVDFPGQVLLRLHSPTARPGLDQTVLVDPAEGEILDRDGLRDLSERATGHPDFDPGRLAPVAGSFILRAMLEELRGVLAHERDYPRLLLVLQRLCDFSDRPTAVLRDRGHVFARLGAYRAALSDLESYVTALPEAVDAAQVRAEIESIKLRLGRQAPSYTLN